MECWLQFTLELVASIHSYLQWMLSVVMCYICSRFTQICDCCRWFGQQQQQQDDHDAAGKTDQSSMTSSLRTMVCLLTSHQVTSPDISIRTKEVIAAARQQGLSGSLYSNMRSTALPRTDKKFVHLCFFVWHTSTFFTCGQICGKSI